MGLTGDGVGAQLLLEMIYNCECALCKRYRRVNQSTVIQGKNYCRRCFRFLTEDKELPMPESLAAPPEADPHGRRTASTVKWWDPELRIWRWVSKRSKPKLEPK